jgi:hypothetical protein
VTTAEIAGRLEAFAALLELAEANRYTAVGRPSRGGDHPRRRAAGG